MCVSFDDMRAEREYRPFQNFLCFSQEFIVVRSWPSEMRIETSEVQASAPRFVACLPVVRRRHGLLQQRLQSFDIYDLGHAPAVPEIHGVTDANGRKEESDVDRHGN